MAEVGVSAARVTVSSSRSDIRRWLNEDRDIERSMLRRGNNVVQAARRYVGVDTGLLLRTIRMQPGHGVQGPYVDVVAGREGRTPYMGWHHDGTAPHIIRPVRREALRFRSGGREIFAARVMHPGTQGTRFLTRALPAMRRD